jgi:cyclopropane fatty-acyl-phospholipid synthase-like methyltransferase
LGISTAARSEAFPGGRHLDAHACAPTSYLHLESLAAVLPLNGDDVFVDVGCGRGRVVCFMAAKGPRKIVGVELREDLAERSRANAAAVASRGGAPIEILRCDAAALPPAVVDEGTVFYLFHPFGPETLRDFVDGLGESLRRRPRSVAVVYNTPIHRGCLDGRGWLVEDFRSDRIVIWRGGPDEAGQR